MSPLHPREALFDAGEPAVPDLPVCDHYAGVEPRMSKSLELQAEMGPVFDVTLDNEDGAPVGGEAEHAHLVSELALAAEPGARVAVRVHAVDHPAFEADVATVVGRAGHRWCHVMVPKVESVADVERLRADLQLAAGGSGGVVGEIEKTAIEEFQGSQYSGYGIGTRLEFLLAKRTLRDRARF